MGGVVQQINLYRGHEAASASSAGARRLVYAGVGALAIVLGLGFAGEVYLSGINADREAVAGRLHKRETALAAFKQKLPSPVLDPFLEAELTRLHEVQTSLNANLAAIGRHKGLASSGFSAFFGGLARNTLDGIWLSNVDVAAGGSEMSLRGQAIEPALVPRLLQSLATEKAFAGRTFRKVSFERRELEGKALVDFELRSAQSEEVDDAG